MIRPAVHRRSRSQSLSLSPSFQSFGRDGVQPQAEEPETIHRQSRLVGSGLDGDADRADRPLGAGEDDTGVVGYRLWLDGFVGRDTADTEVTVKWFNDDMGQQSSN